MLKSVFNTVLSCIIIVTGVVIIAALAGCGKVAYDVYNEIDHRQTPVGQTSSQLHGLAENVGLERRTLYKQFVRNIADRVEREFASH